MSMEGFTFDPNDEPIENMQVLGSSTGKNVLEALKRFKREHSYLRTFAFQEVIAVEYVGDFIHHLEL